MLYYVVFTVIAVIFFIRRRPRRGMRLKLRGGFRFGSRGHLDGMQPPAEDPVVPRERHLNVVFSFGGKTLDAYEVLGLPAGSSPEKVEQIYRERLSRASADERPLLEAAYRALQKP